MISTWCKNLKNVFVIACVLSNAVCLSRLSAAESTTPDLRFYTEIAPPFYWLDEKGIAKGVNVDLVNALAELTSMRSTIEHLPWARAYVEAKNNKDIVLLTVLRTAPREAHLQWLGIVHTSKASLIGLKNNDAIDISSLEESKQRRIGTVRGYGAATFLMSEGFIEGDNLELASNPDQLWSMLFKGRIDLVLDDIAVGRYSIENAGFNSENVHSFLSLTSLDAELELATGLSTDTGKAQKLRDALVELKQSGQFQRIKQKWNL